MSNIPISSLPVSVSLAGDELVPIVQAGTTKTTTTQQIANLVQGDFVPTTRSINTGASSGLSGGGSLATDLNLILDVEKLDPLTNPTVLDSVPVNDSISGETFGVTLDNFYKTIAGLTHKSLPASADRLPVYSIADSAARYSTVNELLAAAGSLPTGGTIGQPLIKRSSTDFDTEFATLPVIGGGTGAITLTSHGILLGQGTSAVVATAAMTDGQLLIGQTGADPSPETVTGDVTISALGVTAIGANKVQNSMLRQSAGLSVIGRSASTTGDVADVTGTADQVLRVAGAGASLGFGSIDLSKSATVGVSVLGATNGGIGQSSYTLGDIIYSSAADTLSKLAGNTTAVKQYLSQTGTGTASAAPAWATISGGDITGAALTKVDDTNVTLTLGGTPATALLRAASITAGWTGQLGLSRGGTNADLSATGGTGRVLKQTSLGAAVTVATVAASEISSPAALTKVDDTNVTLTLGGAPTTALLSATSITAGWTGQLGVTRGGTGIGSVAQGDLLYGSAANTISALAKNTTATRYLANTGTTNNPAWDQVNLTNGVTGTLPVGNGGTGVASPTAHDLLIGNGSSAMTQLAPSATSGVPLVSNGASADPSYSTALVAGGGTGATSFTAYSVLCGGTTSTGALQNVSGVGTSGQVLTSNGASALPTWQSVAGTGTVTSVSAGAGMNFSTITGSGSVASRAPKVITFTWDISLTTNFSVTGVGFQPRAAIFIGSVLTVQNIVSWGVCDGTTGAVVGARGTAANVPNYGSPAGVMSAAVDVANQNQAAIVSLDSDGFTFSRTKTGSPTGTFTAIALCFA